MATKKKLLQAAAGNAGGAGGGGAGGGAVEVGWTEVGAASNGGRVAFALGLTFSRPFIEYRNVSPTLVLSG